MIHIVGLGPGSKGSITKEVLELIQNHKVFLRTKEHPIVEEFDHWGIEYETFDSIYEKSPNFEEVYERIAQFIVNKAKAEGEVIYGVPGHPMIAERSVVNLLTLGKKEGMEVKIYPAVSFIEPVIASLGRDPVKGLLVLDAQDVAVKGLYTKVDVLITQVYNQRVAADLKLALGDFMADEAAIYFLSHVGLPEEEVREIPLWQLDRQKLDHLTSVYVPVESLLPNFADFKATVDALRNPGGCPWDQEQTFESLRRYLIEEAYEAIDAVNEGNMEDFCEELGDVLLQVVLNSRIAQEEGDFTIHDVIRSVNEKMIRRHPHVFGEIELKSSEAVLTNWEKIKKTEKGEVGLEEKLKGLPRSIPAMMRAREVAKKAKAYGIPNPTPEEIFLKISQAVANGMPKDEKAMGDLLYDTAMLANGLDFEAESILSQRVDRQIQKVLETANEENKEK